MQKSEMEEKGKRVRQFMKEKGLEGLLLSTQANFAWFTGGGRNYVALNTRIGVAAILITHKEKFIITNNIEAPRIMEEEVAGQGFIIESHPWYEDRTVDIAGRIVNAEIGSDSSFPETKCLENEIDSLRFSLSAEEIKRYKWLGEMAGRLMGKVAKEVKKGDKETEVAARLSGALISQGIDPVVVLIAADERISKFRHPLPTEKTIDKCCMLVLCARHKGLIASLSRLVHFGNLSEELKRKHQAVAKIDAALISGSKPGVKIRDLFVSAQEVYKETGYADEWQLHHQGGPTGYATRDYVATPGNSKVIQPNQALAWNPSITGTKSEDTIIAREEKTEIITVTPDWPMIEVEIGGQTRGRPDILRR